MPQFVVAWIVSCVITLFGGYLWGSHSRGVECEAAATRNQLAHQKAVAAALEAKQAAEAKLAQKLKEQSDAHSKDLAAAAAAAADARRELARLRHAIASAGDRQQPQSPGAGPAPDGSTAVAGELLGECAGELVAMGEAADGLAAKVIALQAYVKTVVER